MYEALKQTISQKINDNTNKEITPAKVREALNAMVDSLGANSQFAGVATTSTNPGTPEQKVFYVFANETNAAVQLSNFDSVTAPANSFSIISNATGSWVLTTLPVELTSKQSVVPVRIETNDWNENVAEVSVSGVIADDDAQMVQIVPKPASAEDFADAGVVCTTQANGSLSFSCTQTPEADIELYAVLTKISL